MKNKDLKALKKSLLQYKKTKSDGWTRSDIDLVIRSIEADISEQCKSHRQ